MKAQEALFRIMDRLKNPTVDSFFPLKLEVLTHLGEVEMQLIRMTLNNNRKPQFFFKCRDNNLIN